MSVGVELGFAVEGPVAVSSATWSRWGEQHSVLAGFEGVVAMRAWLRTADRADAEAVLWALAQLAAVDGGDDLDAAAWLCWSLLGGASMVARRLTGVPTVDQAVAAALWLEVRQFSWRTRSRVSSNILCEVRARVLADCGRSQRRPQVNARARLVLVPDVAVLDHGVVDPDPFDVLPADRLAGLLAWACREQVISEAERGLLMCLVEVMDELPRAPKLGPRQGMFGHLLSVEVGKRLGVSSRTVKRLTRVSIDALSAAVVRYGIAA